MTANNPVKKFMLQPYTQAVMVMARREYVATKPTGSLTDLVKPNKIIADKIHEHFYTANKERNPYRRHYKPSRSRNDTNELVDITFLRNAARAVLGPKATLPKLDDRGLPEILKLDKIIIQHIFPVYDFSCFEKFSTFHANIPTYRQWLRSNSLQLTPEETAELKIELKDLRDASAALAVLLEHPVISELTNFYQERKNEGRGKLRHISMRQQAGRARSFFHFMNEIIAADKILRCVYEDSLFNTSHKPSILAKRFEIQSTPRLANELTGTEVQNQLSIENHTQRGPASSPTARGRVKSRHQPTKYMLREKAGQQGLAFA